MSADNESGLSVTIFAGKVLSVEGRSRKGEAQWGPDYNTARILGPYGI